jgi:hypothetical protein
VDVSPLHMTTGLESRVWPPKRLPGQIMCLEPLLH